jgi:hypothetical protein
LLISPDDPDPDAAFYRRLHLNSLAREYCVLGPEEWHLACSVQLQTYHDWCELFDELNPNGTEKGYVQ